jgi:hypothetical protein
MQADFYAGGAVERALDARSASKTQHEQLSATRIQRFRSRWRATQNKTTNSYVIEITL